MLYKDQINKETLMEEYKQLPFTNDFIFSKVLQNDPDLCKHLLEIILDIKIEKIQIEIQKTLKETADNRGVRLDVWVNDSYETVYDMEMQTTNKRNLPKRTRYYQSMIDIEMLEKGCSVNGLRKSYIIFICTDDFLNGGLCRYTFERKCIEKEDVVFEDEARTIIINPGAAIDKMSCDMRRFLDYIANGIPTDEFTEALQADVMAARSKDEWREEYMTLKMREREIFEEGVQDGIQQGIQQGFQLGTQNGEEMMSKLIQNLKKDGRDDEIGRVLDDNNERKRMYDFYGIMMQ